MASQIPSGKVMDITGAGGRLDRPGRRGGGRLAGRRQAVRRAVLPPRRRLLVPQGPVREGRHQRPAGDDGRPQRRGRQAQVRRHRPDRDRRQGPLARRVLVGVLRPPRVLDRHAEGGDEGHRPQRPVLREGERAQPGVPGHQAVPDGLPRHARPAGRGQLGRHGRQRQGGDGAAGHVGARRDGGADRPTRSCATSSAGSRSRRSKAARAIRASRSAAATASRARPRRPTPASSS